MKYLRRLWYALVPTYKRTDLKFVSYSEGDALLRQNELTQNEDELWRIAKEEDFNNDYGMVYLERRKRITE